MLTGCRLNQIKTLTLGGRRPARGRTAVCDAKTGDRMVPLSRAAVSALLAPPRPDDNPWVIIGKKLGVQLPNSKPLTQRQLQWTVPIRLTHTPTRCLTSALMGQIEVIS